MNVDTGEFRALTAQAEHALTADFAVLQVFYEAGRADERAAMEEAALRGLPPADGAR